MVGSLLFIAFYGMIAFGCLSLAFTGELPSGVSATATWARVAFGVFGAAFVYPVLRGLNRFDELGKKPTPEMLESEEYRRRRVRGQRMGVVFFLVGAAFTYLGFAAGLEDAIAVHESWAKTVLIVCGIALLLLGLLSQMSGEGMARTMRKQQLTERFLEGRARVLEIADTGVTINDNPRFKLKLEITIAGRPATMIDDAMTVPRIGLGRLEPGKDLPIRVHPDDPTIYEIDWGKP